MGSPGEPQHEALGAARFFMRCLCLSESHVCASPAAAQHGAGVPTSCFWDLPGHRTELPCLPWLHRHQRVVNAALLRPLGPKVKIKEAGLRLRSGTSGAEAARTRNAGDKRSHGIGASSSLQFSLLSIPCSGTFSCSPYYTSPANRGGLAAPFPPGQACSPPVTARQTPQGCGTDPRPGSARSEPSWGGTAPQ